MSLYKQNKKAFSTKMINNNISLAKVIENAGTEAAYREVFYNRFLKEDIYVLVQKNKDNQPSLENTPIVVLQNNIIPVFTAPERILDHNAIAEEVDYIKVKGRAFLEMAVGETLIVNPFSKVHKELVPAEISDMLNGAIFNRLSTKKSSSLQMEVMIGHPKDQPHQLLEVLIPYFRKTPEILSAYLGWTFNPKIDKAPHYIIALELTNSNCVYFAKQIAELAKPFQNEEDILDIIQLEEGGTFSEFFYKQSTPFYTKENK